MATPFDTIDDYIASFPDAMRPVLEQLRVAIRAAIPDAEESISYDMPTFGMAGRHLVYLAGWKKHVSLHAVPEMSPRLEAVVAPHRSGRNTVKFPLDRPIPLALVEQIVTEMVHQRTT